MRKIICFLFTITIAASLFSYSLIDRGYLMLEGPQEWNDSYVIYKLTTSNEKGGKAKTVFKENSHNHLLQEFEYTSKEFSELEKEKYRVYNERRFLK